MKLKTLKSLVLSAVIGFVGANSDILAEPAKKGPDPEAVLAKFEDKSFKLKDAGAMAQALGPQLQSVPIDKLLPILRDAWLQEQIYIREAKKEKMQKSPEYKSALRKVKRQILVEVYLAKLSEELVTEDKIDKAYKEEIKKKYSDSSKEEVKIQHIQVKTRAKAQDVIRLLKSKSMDFDQAVSKFSENKENNGVLGFVSDNTESLIPAVRDAALALKKEGDFTTEPVKSMGGWHVFKALEVRKIKKPSKDELLPVLHRRLTRDEMSNHFKKLKTKYKVKEFPLPDLGAPKASGDGDAPKSDAAG